MAPVREAGRVGRRGAWVIPAALRRRFGLEEGALLLVEETQDGILLRPAAAVAVEVYTPERRAALLLENAVDAADYAGAVAAVRAMGLDADAIPHQRPPGTAAPRRRAR
jgi:AbrB family looped-hinge helix DNA binding protein